MTNRATERLDRRVSAFQQRLGLNGWSIQRTYYADDHLPEDVRGKHDGDSCIGSSDAWARIEHAHIHVACGDEKHGPEEIACHELLHVLHAPMEEAIGRLREQVGVGAWEVAFGAYKDAEELVVRRLTTALNGNE